jgi:hypothetical protein
VAGTEAGKDWEGFRVAAQIRKSRIAAQQKQDENDSKGKNKAELVGKVEELGWLYNWDPKGGFEKLGNKEFLALN